MKIENIIRVYLSQGLPSFLKTFARFAKELPPFFLIPAHTVVFPIKLFTVRSDLKTRPIENPLHDMRDAEQHIVIAWMVTAGKSYPPISTL